MTENRTVTTAVFRAEEEGVAATAAALGRLQTAAGGASSATNQFTKTSQESASKLGDVERRVDQLQRQLAGAPQAWKAYERGMAAASVGFQAGKLTAEQYASSIQQLQTQLQKVVAPRLTLDVNSSGLSQMLGATEKVSASTRQATNDLLRMAQAKQAADAEMARGQEMLARETARYSAEIDSLRASYDPAYASAQRLNAELEDLARLEREGIQITGGYEAAMDRLVDKYDEVGQASRRSAQGQAEFIRQARADQNSANARDDGQAMWNSYAGYRPPSSGAARASASVFEADAQAMERMATQAARLRAELDPLAAAQQRMTAEVSEFQALADRQLISQDELVLATSRSRQAYEDVERQLKPTGEAIKLTSGQVQNLGYQTNDLLTMWAMGASPFSIISSQAGQIVQALGDGPGGVRGSLQAIGSSAKSMAISTAAAMGPVGLAFAGVVTAAGAFALIMRESVPDANETLEKHSAILERVAQQYKGVSEILAEIDQRSGVSVKIELGAAGDDLRKVLKQQMGELERSLAGGGGFLGTSLFGTDDTSVLPSLPKFKPIQGMLDIFRQSLRDGDADARQFNGSLQMAYDNAGDDTELKKAIQAVQALIKPLVATSAELEKNGLAASGAAEAMARYRGAMDDLRGFIPDLRTEAQKINEAFALAATGPADGDEMVARFQQQKALAADAMDAFDRLNAARAEGASIGLGEEAKAVAVVEQEYAKLKLQYEGNADALVVLEQARAQAIDNAGAQAAFDREQEAAKEREAAAKRATDEAQRYAEATRSRIAGIDQTVASQRMEVELLGQSEGATAALRFEFQALTAAKQAAAAAGGIVSDAELAKIREAADEIGRLTDALAAQNAANSAVDQFFPFEAAAREAERLGGYIADASNGLSDLQRQALQLQIDQGFVDAADAVEQLRTRGTRAAEDIGKSFTENVGDTFADIFSSAIQDGENFFDSILRGFAGLGSQLAAAGARSIFGKIFNLPDQAGASNAAGIGGLFAGAGASYAAPGAAFATSAVTRSTTGASAAIERQFIPALGKATTGLTAAAKAIRTIESGSAGGNYSAMGPVTRSGDRAYGAYQVMGANIPQWSQAALGRVVSNVEFLGNPKLQDAIFEHRFGGYMQKYGAEGAARAWFAGEGGMKNWNARDVVGTSVGGYGGRFSSLYNQHGGARSATAAYTDQRIVTRGVTEGLKDYNRQYAPSYGDYTAAGIDPWNDGQTNLRGGGTGLFSQNGLGVLGAGVGAFGSGYQSGSPFSGGLSGALGGYQAGGAISGMLGIGAGAGAALGVVGGAALGILGGILGGRAQRKQEHKDKAARWAEMQPQYEAFDQSLTGEQGGIRAWLTDTWGQLSGFMKVGGDAWKYGSGNSTAQFASTGRKMFDRFDEMLVEFRDGFDVLVEDLSSGEGLAGSFARGRAATKDLKAQIEGMLDDVSIAFGSDDIGIPVAGFYTESAKAWEEARNAALAQAKAAAGEYALSMLYTADTTSDVEKALDGFRGTAAGLQSVLEDLGWTAEDAAADISDRLTQAIADMGRTFVEGFQAEINALSGEGYLNDFADLIKARDTGLSDAALLGADTGIVTKWFGLAAQDIVDGSELVGSAFDALIKAFPELSGVVHEFTGAARTAAEAAAAAQQAALASYEASKSQLESVYQTVLSYRDGIRSFLDGLKLGDESTLSQRDQLDEAERIYRDTLAKANAGDKEAMGNLTGAAQDYLSEARDYFASSEDYAAIFDSVNASLKSADAKATSQIDLMRSQARWLEDIAGSNIELAKTMADFVAAQKALNANRSWGVMADQNKAIWNELYSKGIDYTGNFGGGQFLDWVSAQAQSMQAIIRPIIDKWSAIYAPKGFASGGYTGGMATNAVAGVVHGQEFVAHAEATRRWRPQLEAMNAGAMRLPEIAPVRMPSIKMSGEDNRALLAELRESNRLLRQQIATTGQGLAQNVQATERGNRSTQDMAMTARRDQIRERVA